MTARPVPEKTPESAYTTRALVGDLYAMLKPHRPRFFLASFARVCGDLAMLYPAYAIASIATFFSRWKPGESTAPFWTIMALMVAAVLVRLGGYYAAKQIGFRITEKVAIDAQIATIDHLFRLDIAWHEQENAGSKLKRIQRGAESVQRVLRMWLINYLHIAVNVVGILALITTFDPVISAAMLFFVVTFYAASRHLTRRASAASIAVNLKEEEMSGLTFEAINNIRSAKVLGMTDALMEIIRKCSVDLFAMIRLRIHRFQTRGMLLGAWARFFELVGIAVIGYGITQGRYDLGFLLLFYGYFGRLWDSINELSEVTQEFVIARHGIGRMAQLMAEPILIDDETGKVDFPKDWKSIAIRDLSFSYAGREVLKSLSFEIERGERLGVVGLSGAGKSTLFKLLLKENEDYTGEISVDGVPLRSIKKSSYFKGASVVLQETEVFNFSLRDNVTIADADRTKDGKMLKRALDVAHVSDFLMRLPEGVDTLIGEKGVKLSGGERQRLGIARAVFKQPEILFLDEATSHLDMESEEKIRDSLHEFFQSVTAVVIAHRLTTIKEMDRILVLEEGRLIESGTFDELYKKKGRFRELWDMQKL